MFEDYGDANGYGIGLTRDLFGQKLA